MGIESHNERVRIEVKLRFSLLKKQNFVLNANALNFSSNGLG